MIHDKYILNEAGEPVECNDLMTWAKWFEESASKRVVRKDTIGESKVSTVFLGLNHQYGKGIPILWETMVFGGDCDGDQNRCGGSREQAETMHREMVARVREKINAKNIK